MKDAIKAKAIKIKNHVASHKFAYAATAVAVTVIVSQQKGIKGFSAFLEEKGIDPNEYFNPEYFAELNS